nr:carboxylesterase family protein [Polaribacter sp. Hel_I_88]
MKIFITFLCCFILQKSFCQTLYLNEVTKVSKKTRTYKKLDSIKLKLDFYKPRRMKSTTPLILYVHGGGFSGGKRDDINIESFANNMAERGYAVASISYQLTMKKLGFGCNTKSSDKINAFNTASDDIIQATNYLIKYKERFNINPNQIILMGTSAGAEAVLNLAYVYTSKTLSKEVKFAGVISMAGAIITLDNITTKTAIPTQLFHGTNDKLVPYNVAPHHYCDKNSVGYLKLYGSKAIANKLKEIDKSFYLYTIKKGDHSWSGRPMNQCRKEIVDFLYYDVLKKNNRQTETAI